MTIALKDFDVVDFLKTEEAMEEYLNAALEEGDVKFLFTTLGDIARAKNLSKLSRDSGISHEEIFKALSEEGNPAFITIFKIINALGLKMNFLSQKPAEKIIYTRGKIHAEIAKLMAETKKIDKENFWHPVLISSGLIVTVATVTAFIIKFI